MTPLKAPDLTTPGRMAWLAVLVAVAATVILYVQDMGWLAGAFGDTDDATRIVMVRELLAGRGWWDQHWMRVQPPMGVYMHWSRLLDGGLALMTLFFRLFTTAQNAEYATRLVWPMLWIMPSAWSVLVISRTLATSTGAHDRAQPVVIAATMMMLINLGLYAQFRPGRVDHHNVQIALALLALAGGVQPSQRRGWAVCAGVSAGFGLAVGLEAIFFQVLVGAMIAFRFALNPAARRFVTAYAAALGLTTIAAYAIQTPPDRWLMSACDAEGANLATAVAVGASLLVVGMRLSQKRDSRFRVLGLAVAGAAALAVYLALEPNCVHGPFADVDPRIRAFWLDHVTEVANLPTVYKRSADTAFSIIATGCLALAALAFLMVQPRRLTDHVWWLVSLSLLLALIVGWQAARMTAYLDWLAVPLMAVAAGAVARRYEGQIGLFAAVGAGLVLAPIGWSGMASQVNNALPSVTAALAPKAAAHGKPGAPAPVVAAKKKDPPDYCFNGFPYKALNRAPKGLTLSEIDLGPFVLAYSPSSTLSAPYHRLSWGIMQAEQVLAADADHAYPMVRKLGVTYVLACPNHANHADRTGQKPTTLQRRLDRADAPPWLEAMTPPKSPVMIYRVVAPLAKTK